MLVNYIRFIKQHRIGLSLNYSSAVLNLRLYEYVSHQFSASLPYFSGCPEENVRLAWRHRVETEPSLVYPHHHWGPLDKHNVYFASFLLYKKVIYVHSIKFHFIPLMPSKRYDTYVS